MEGENVSNGVSFVLKRVKGTHSSNSLAVMKKILKDSDIRCFSHAKDQKKKN